jgi:CRP-like cAMP-binding protein
LLGNRVRRLLLAFALLNVAEWSFMTAFGIYAIDRQGTLGVGLIGLRFLAAAISSATLAPFVEARRRVTTISAVMRAALLAIVALMAVAGMSLWALLAVVLIDAVVGACYRPAQQRLIPSLVHTPSELMRAVAGCSTAKTLGQAVGGTAGGIVLAVFTPAATMAGGALVMCLAAICVFGPGSARTSHLLDSASSLLEGIRAVPEVFGDRVIWPLVTAGILRTLVRGLWGALLFVVSLRLLHTGSTGVGLFQGAAGVGAVLAVWVTATQVGRPRLAPACVVAFAATGLTIGVIGASVGYVMALIAIGAWGLSMAVADSTSMALLHRALDPSELLRTIGVMETLKFVAEGVGALLAPALVALFGLRLALVVAGLPMPVLMVLTGSRIYAADERAEGRGRLAGLLHGVALFSGLDLASIESLASRLQPVERLAGEDLVTQGTPGDLFYVLESGEVEVLVDEYPIGELGPGRWVGERALLRASLRTATVRALSSLRAWGLDRADFLQAMTGYQLAEPNNPDQVFGREPTAVPVVELLAALTSFSSADGPALERLAKHAERVEFERGSALFREGETSDTMYVLLSGHAEAVTEDGMTTTPMQPGDAFGEIGVLHGKPRSRTVIADDHLVVLSLPAHEVLLAAGRQPHAPEPTEPHDLLLEPLVPLTAAEPEIEAAS